jgi:hypothetical protein
MPSGQKFTLSFHVPGTLGADLNIRYKAPSNCQLVHVSAVGSNTAAAGLTLGSSADVAAYMTKKSIGVSNTPVEFDFDDFLSYASKAYPRITDGTIVLFALDYDYNGGGGSTASADVTIVATFLEG